jgi:uncharacterized membrane-anchored protein YjiN (DUF445 family)
LKSKIGHISLLFAIGGLVITEACIYWGLLQGPIWRILVTGFEAATIGGLADWFAVSALFHKIPIPIVSRHTNIIVKNRSKLTEAIVELVTTKWLSSEIILEKLGGVQIAAGIFTVLEKPANMDRVMDFLRSALYRFSDNMDNPEVALLFQKLLKDQMEGLEIAGPLGSWLEGVVKERDHHRLVELVLEESTQALDEPATRAIIHAKLKWGLESYEKMDWVKRSAIWLGKKTGGIDLDVLTDRLLDIARMLAAEARTDPGHPLRHKLDQSLLKLSHNLQMGEPDVMIFIHQLKHKIVEGKETQSMLLDIFSRLKITFTKQLANKETVFMKLLRKNAERLIENFRRDNVTLEKIDEWVKRNLAQLIDKNHHEIGNMVRLSLSKLDDTSLMLQIKEKVGDDLQYIRLNGAVVGGLVGVFIAVVRMLMVQ